MKEEPACGRLTTEISPPWSPGLLRWRGLLVGSGFDRNRWIRASFRHVREVPRWGPRDCPSVGQLVDEVFEPGVHLAASYLRGGVKASNSVSEA